MREVRKRRGALPAVLLVIGLLAGACSSEPAPPPTLEPVLPPLPSAMPAATVAPQATTTPVPLDQGGATPVPGGVPLITPLPLGDGGTVLPLVLSSASPSCLGAAPGAARLPGQRLGVNIVPGDQLEQALDQARDMNAGWVRTMLRWSDLEPQQRAYRWEQIDALADGARARGLLVDLVITGSPAWATSTGGGGLPDNPEDFGAFMGVLASHARGKIAAYEIWQNPNTAAANGGTVAEPGQYVELLKSAYQATKSADPCALVLNGALLPTATRDSQTATDDLAFYRSMLTYNDGEVKDAYDILAVQLNTSGMAGKGKWPRAYPSQSRGFYGHIEGIRNNMEAGDEGEKNVWVVQTGYQVAGEFPVTPEQQAEYLTDLYEITRKSYPWAAALFVRELGAGADAGFSLMNADGSPRPVYTRLRDLFATERAKRTQAPSIKGTDLVEAWSFWPNIRPIGRLVLGPDGAIYSPTNIGFVRVVDPNGAFRLSVKPSKRNVLGVAIDYQQQIYVNSDDSTLAAYSPGGEQLWAVLTDGPTATPLLISQDGQTLYVGASSERLHAYATSDGHKLWETPLGGISGAPALGPDGTIYVSATEGTFHAIAADGTPRWTYPAGAWVAFAPAVTDASIYGVTNTGAAFALDPGGAQRWRVELGVEPTGWAAGQDGTLYITTIDGQLHAIAADGTPRWTTRVGNRPTAPAVGADGRIYVGTEEGGFHVVTPEGAIAGTFGFDSPISIPPLAGADGAVYVALSDYLIAFGKPELKERYNVP